MKRICLPFVFFTFFGKSLLAQQTEPKKFKLFFEKVYLHTDREHYVPGEDIWFKAYLVNGQTNQLIGSSNNLYVELISPQSEVVSCELIRLDHGLGNGDFKLRDSIVSGSYYIRAYTNWMRNFGENFIFEKVVHIAGSAPVTATQKAVNASSSSIRFFPEGGSMIEGAAGIVAFKAENISGDGIKVRGQIVSSDGKTLSRFESTNEGAGSFMLQPKPGLTYFAKGTFSDGSTFNQKLPRALKDGFALHLQNEDSVARVMISTNPATLKRLQGKKLFLTGKSRGKSYYTSEFTLQQLQSAISIPLRNFPAGIAVVTLYDDLGRPDCERLFYVNETDQTNISIIPDKPVYQSKDKVTINIRVINQNNQPVKANLSLAAVDAGIVPVNTENIVSYLMLQSEVRGKIEHPEQYFDVNNANRFRQLDLLLMTQGWRDFIWKRLADSALKISYLPEQGITISGRVRQIWADKPVAGANITLSAPHKLLAARTDSTGRYYFDGLQFYGSQPIGLTSRNDKGKKLGWILMDSLFLNPLPVISKPVLVIENNTSSQHFIVEAVKRKDLIKKANLSDTIQLEKVTVKASKFLKLWDQKVVSFGYPDQVFNITKRDYDYQDLRHYLMTNVAGALSDSDPSRNRILFPGGYQPRLIINNKDIAFNDDDPPELVDHYYNTYFGLPMDKVEKVIVKHMIEAPKLRLGDNTTTTNAYGTSTTPMSTVGPVRDVYIIDLTIKPNAFEKKEFDAIHSKVNGYYQARTFYAPKYETVNSKTDLRTTIYWEPNITTNKNGEATITYYNADPKTKVRIVVEGITNDGTPVTASATYEVK